MKFTAMSLIFMAVAVAGQPAFASETTPPDTRTENPAQSVAEPDNGLGLLLDTPNSPVDHIYQSTTNLA